MSGVKGQRGNRARSKTIAQHDLEGTRNVTRHKGFRNPEVPEGEPAPPFELSDDVRPYWVHAVGELRKMRTLSVVDSDAIWVLAKAWRVAELLDEAVYGLAFPPDAGARQTIGLSIRAWLSVVRYMKNFELTPDSRGRVRIPTDGDENPVNPLVAIQQQSAALRRVK